MKAEGKNVLTMEYVHSRIASMIGEPELIGSWNKKLTKILRKKVEYN